MSAGLVLLGACSQPSNSPDDYGEQARSNFMEACTGRLLADVEEGTTEITAETVGSDAVCGCLYEFFESEVEFSDFSTIDGDLAEDSSDQPAELKLALEKCGTGPVVPAGDTTDGTGSTGPTTTGSVSTTGSTAASVPDTTDGASTTSSPPSIPQNPDSPPTTAERLGSLPPIKSAANIRLKSCEPNSSSHMVAVVELDNVTDLPLDGEIEVLFEDANARQLETAVGKTEIIQPGASGTATIVSDGAIAADGVDCLVIGLLRTEHIP